MLYESCMLWVMSSWFILEKIYKLFVVTNKTVRIQYKVVRVLTELCKLVMRPPNQLRAVANKS